MRPLLRQRARIPSVRFRVRLNLAPVVLRRDAKDRARRKHLHDERRVPRRSPILFSACCHRPGVPGRLRAKPPILWPPAVMHDHTVPIVVASARPPSPCEGSRGAVHPVILVESSRRRSSMESGKTTTSRSPGSILADHCEPEKYSLAIARHLKCSSSTRARRRGERPMQTARSLGPRTVCSCPSVSLGNTSAFGEA